MEKRNLSFWQLFNLSFGFFGVQIAYALQSANISRIFATLGADPHTLSFFWILPPLMGMIIQPLIGLLSDKTWLGPVFGRRKFYLLIGAVIAVFIHTKFSKSIKREQVLDIFAISIPLFHVFGRIGCALGGCCYGIESEFGYTIYNNYLLPEVNGVNRFPVQLTEAAINLIIFLILLFMYKRNRMQEKLIYCYMIMYPIARFILEFLRGDIIRGIWFGLSTSQWISIILFVFAISKLIYFKREKMA